MKGFVLGGTSSRVGKTVATLAVIRALRAEGHEVQPAKAGPDFIDPSHHAVVADRPSRTLDVWLQGESGALRNYHRGDGDVCPVEGVMGLYDGAKSSTAMVAETLGVPVVLVVDASAGMESVAATALGFREYAGPAGRDIEVAGVLVQKAHGGRHERGIRDALPEDMTYFGRIPPRDDLDIPDRHLGLHLGQEAPLADDALSAATEHVDVDRLLDVARVPPDPATIERGERPSGSSGPASSGPASSGPASSEPASSESASSGPASSESAPSESQSTQPRIVVARDEAFCFVYPATLERLGELGEVVTVSPVAGEALPDCDGVYLPGGYPELHGEALAGSQTLEAIAGRAADGLPVFGECGGMMALAESLTTAEDETYPMAGVLPARVEMHDRYQALDHVELEARRGTVTAAEGGRLRGHEFHYSSVDLDGDARFAFDVTRGDGIDGEHDGLVEHRALGTYCHVHPESGAFDRFVESVGRG